MRAGCVGITLLAVAMTCCAVPDEPGSDTTWVGNITTEATKQPVVV